MPSRGWDIPVDEDTVTTPARIEPEARRQVRLLEGERILRVWKTGGGFLIMTNLRVTEVLRRPQVFSPSDWEAGPSFFFYDLAPPKVEFRRFLRLVEEKTEGRAAAVRLFLHDPLDVALEIEAARVEGRDEWLRRRARVEGGLREAQKRWEASLRLAGRTGERPVLRVRCGYCGNLIDAAAARCPYCGAPQPV